MIVREFLNGDSLKGIKEKLEKASIPSPARESKWTTQTILRILQNEKYAGDVLLQKTYTSDFLEGKVKKNNGKVKAGLKTKGFFFIMRMIQKSGWNEADKNYWAERGWNGKNRPWKNT